MPTFCLLLKNNFILQFPLHLFVFPPTELSWPGGDKKCPNQSTFKDDPTKTVLVHDAATGLVTVSRLGLLLIPIRSAELPWTPSPWPLQDPQLQAYVAQHQCLTTSFFPNQPPSPSAAVFASPTELHPQPAPQHATGFTATHPVPFHGTTGTAPDKLFTTRPTGELYGSSWLQFLSRNGLTWVSMLRWFIQTGEVHGWHFFFFLDHSYFDPVIKYMICPGKFPITVLEGAQTVGITKKYITTSLADHSVIHGAVGELTNGECIHQKACISIPELHEFIFYCIL